MFLRIWFAPYLRSHAKMAARKLSGNFLSNRCINANKLMYNAANGQTDAIGAFTTHAQELAVSGQNSTICKRDAWTERHTRNTAPLPSRALINSRLHWISRLLYTSFNDRVRFSVETYSRNLLRDVCIISGISVPWFRVTRVRSITRKIVRLENGRRRRRKCSRSQEKILQSYKRSKFRMTCGDIELRKEKNLL